MREIEFRAKSKNKDKWVYGDLLHPEHNDNCYSIFKKMDGCVKVKPNTIGQYTGLKDKNGTKIFEGDIVKADFAEYNRNYEVIYFKCGFKLKSKDCQTLYDYSIHDETPDLEVIGNIYDNPELLKGEK